MKKRLKVTQSDLSNAVCLQDNPRGTSESVSGHKSKEPTQIPKKLKPDRHGVDRNRDLFENDQPDAVVK